MAISKTLRKPANWQDFETLCKKLWSEIWNYAETKKNGRAGQEQFGVDVYGIPQGESEYYGIQCKGRDEYSKRKFTTVEIEEEISKAIHFKPKLKKFYLATTALKDVKIERFVREKNLEHISKGLFEVHIFSWEDIVDLIDENKRTHDWYVKNNNYKTNKAVKVTFQNNSTELIITPKFKKIVIWKRSKEILSKGPISTTLDAVLAINKKIHPLLPNNNGQYLFSKPEINRSYSKICFKIHNIGNAPIEEFKLLAEIKGDIIDLNETNRKPSDFDVIMPKPLFSDVDINVVQQNVTIAPLKKILVGDDVYTSNEFYIKPKAESYEIELKWKLISKNYKAEGSLKLFIKPEFKRQSIEKFVDDPKEEGMKVKEINDFIE